MAERIRQIVRRAFEEIGMTYQELADRTGIERAHLSRYLNGKTDIQTTSLEKLCDALGIDLNRLKD